MERDKQTETGRAREALRKWFDAHEPGTKFTNKGLAKKLGINHNAVTQLLNFEYSHLFEYSNPEDPRKPKIVLESDDFNSPSSAGEVKKTEGNVRPGIKRTFKGRRTFPKRGAE